METDVLVIGSGPAGMQAAIHASRRKLKVTVLGKIKESNLNKTKIENLSCIEGAISGTTLLECSRKKAEASGVTFLEEDALEILETDGFKVRTEGGSEIQAKSLVIATGIHRSKLGVKGEREYIGKGVAYCADCDAPFFKGKDVAVVGCKSAAANAVILVADYANKVYFICERLDVEEYLKDQMKTANVEMLENASLREIRGDNSVRSVVLGDGRILNVDGVLIELGARGAFELVMPLNVNMDEHMHIKVDRMQRTNVPGIYAAGDVCGPPYQVAKALGEGCVAGLNASRYAREYKHR